MQSQEKKVYNFTSSLTVQLNTSLLGLLDLISHRGGVEPDNDKCQETSNHRPQTGDPHPTTSDGPAARVFVVRKVTHGNLVLLLNVGEERTLVVHTEREDTVLIGNSELGAVHSTGLSTDGRLEGQAVEGREHGEFQLQLILSRDLEGHPLVIGVFGNLKVENL